MNEWCGVDYCFITNVDDEQKGPRNRRRELADDTPRRGGASTFFVTERERERERKEKK